MSFESYECRAQWPRGLRRGSGPLASWDCRFGSRRGHGCLFLLRVVCCQVQVSASGCSLVQRSPTESDVCLSVNVKPR